MDDRQSAAQRLYEDSFANLEQRRSYQQQLKEFRSGERFALVLVADWLDRSHAQDAGDREMLKSEHLEKVMAAFLAINFALMFDGRRTLKNFVLRASPGGFDDSAGVFGAVNYLNALCQGGFADLKNFPNWLSLMGLDRDSDFGGSFLERFYRFIAAIGQSAEGDDALHKAEVFVDLSEIIDEYITLASTRYFENPFSMWRMQKLRADPGGGKAQFFELHPPEGQTIKTVVGRSYGAEAVLALGVGVMDAAAVECLESGVARRQRFRGLLLDLGGAPVELQLPFLVSVFRVLSDAVRRQI